MDFESKTTIVFELYTFKLLRDTEAHAAVQ